MVIAISCAEPGASAVFSSLHYIALRWMQPITTYKQLLILFFSPKWGNNALHRRDCNEAKYFQMTATTNV